MTICQAVAKRINQLLLEKKMTQYRLEQDSGIQHGTMNGIMSARNKGIELNTSGRSDICVRRFGNRVSKGAAPYLRERYFFI